jgi:MHS family proline/betaine transporter-like MFS transporter
LIGTDTANLLQFASGLISLTGDPLMSAYYMMLTCLVGLVALRFMPETAGRSLRENPFEPAPQSLADK